MYFGSWKYFLPVNFQKRKMDNSICLHFMKLCFIINGLQALSFYKFDIETIKVNHTRTVAIEKKFDNYHALKGEFL